MNSLETEFETKWACLGIAFVNKFSDPFLDPEKTIFDSLTQLYQNRKYLRLFLDWILDYHECIHVERLLSVLKNSATHPLEIQMLSSISQHIISKNKDLRWKIILKYCSKFESQAFRSENDEYLLSVNGANPLFELNKIYIPNESKTAKFTRHKKVTPKNVIESYNQWFYLRGLFGVNWRADVALQIFMDIKNPLRAQKNLLCSYETVHRNWNELKNSDLFKHLKEHIQIKAHVPPKVS